LLPVAKQRARNGDHVEQQTCRCDRWVPAARIGPSRRFERCCPRRAVTLISRARLRVSPTTPGTNDDTAARSALGSGRPNGANRLALHRCPGFPDRPTSTARAAVCPIRGSLPAVPQARTS
jgi:hypothetical protein